HPASRPRPLTGGPRTLRTTPRTRIKDATVRGTDQTGRRAGAVCRRDRGTVVLRRTGTAHRVTLRSPSVRRSTIRKAWTAAFVAVLTVPLGLTWWTRGGALWGMVSVGLGVLALCALLVVVVAPSRIRSLTTAFGVERVMGMHRWLGIGAVGVVIAHLVV